MNKKYGLFIFFLIIIISGYANIFYIDGSYSLTNSSTIDTTDNSFYNEKYDYISLKGSYLFKTEDTDEIMYGPYFGINYIIQEPNTFIKIKNPDFSDFSFSFGLNIMYNTTVFKDIKFIILAYGGVHTEDFLKTYSTEILLKAGLSYRNVYLNTGFETRYYKYTENNVNHYLTVNYIPVSLGVNFEF
ncbi:MAG: hypothetical protein H7A31_01925 [Thermotogae bacterium]|mgnify:CR=1 FL=1|nr:hypothetical protein [Thermotogota bacterium]HOO74219.1 hypothetical protein [Tepiditoga sp.]